MGGRGSGSRPRGRRAASPLTRPPRAVRRAAPFFSLRRTFKVAEQRQNGGRTAELSHQTGASIAAAAQETAPALRALSPSRHACQSAVRIRAKILWPENGTRNNSVHCALYRPVHLRASCSVEQHCSRVSQRRRGDERRHSRSRGYDQVIKQRPSHVALLTVTSSQSKWSTRPPRRRAQQSPLLSGPRESRAGRPEPPGLVLHAVLHAACFGLNPWTTPESRPPTAADHAP